MSDRLALSHGGMGFGLPFEFHAPHNGSVRDSDQDTASSPAASDVFSEFFDYPGYACGEPTDATTPSDVRSDGKSAASPPFVTPAGAAAATPNHDEDSPMPDAPSVEPQQSNLWPRAPGPHPPRDPNIQVETSPSPSPSPSSEMHPEAPSQDVPAPSQKTRILKDRVETSQVRDCGACSRCKMNKSKCDSLSVCHACIGLPFSESICIRTPLRNFLPPKLARWNWNDPSFFIPGREQFVAGHDILLPIASSESIDSPYLQLKASRFAPPSQRDQEAQHGPRWGLAPGRCPSEDVIYQWMEGEIMAERKANFEAQMDKLLVSLVRRPEASAPPEWQSMQPVLLDLLKMRCMWRVWSCKHLFVRQQAGPRVTFVPFDARFASIQDSLRSFAAQAISELERRIVPKIEEGLVAKKNTIGSTVVKWFLLWQTILIYRQSLSWVLGQEQTDPAPIPIAEMPMNERRQFRVTTRRLFEAVTVIYVKVFQKDTTLNKIRKATVDVFGDERLLLAYQGVWKALPEFYQKVLSQVSPTDGVFKEYIVKREAEILAKAHQQKEGPRKARD